MPTSARPSFILLFVLAAALAFGAAASLLIGAATSPGVSPQSVSLVVIPNWLIGDSLLAIIGVVVGVLVYQRFTQGTLPVPGAITTRMVVVLLLAILLLAAYHLAWGTGPAPNGSVTTGQNGTHIIVNNTTTTHNSTATGGSPLFSIPSWPPWSGFVLIAVILLIIAVVAVPLTGRRRGTPGVAKPPERRVIAEVKGALARAAEELDRGQDPRAVILALYGTLLDRLEPQVDDLAVATPEEIRVQHLVRLGIRPEAAMVLTRLFEEARYSSHPITADAADTARRAVRDALADLARTPVPA